MISDNGGDGKSDCDDDDDGDKEEEEKGIWKELSHDYQDDSYIEPLLV